MPPEVTVKRFFKWGRLGVVVLILGATMVACTPASQRASSTATPGQSLAILLPTVTPAPVATETVAPVQPEEPTLEPTATPEPTATLVPTPMPAPLVMTGSGGNITADFQVDAPLIITEFSHDGSGNFAIFLKDAETAENLNLLVNVIGATTGSNLTGIDPGTYFYEVTADGNWTVTTKLTGHWTKQPQATAYSFAGRGDSVSPIFSLSDGRANIALTHNGERNFAVFIYDVNSGQPIDLLVNTIGPANESAAIAASAGDYILQITADGDWTVQVSQ